MSGYHPQLGYGDFNVNHLKLDRVPSFDDWSPICRALRSAEFFVTTGEILIPHWGIEVSGKDRTVFADVEWTFPLEFVETVWGDGENVGRKVISATDQQPFGSRRYRIPFDAAGQKWVRFAVCDHQPSPSIRIQQHANRSTRPLNSDPARPYRARCAHVRAPGGRQRF